LRRISPATFSLEALIGNVEVVRQRPREAHRRGVWKG
jgi:hypothetical protein